MTVGELITELQKHPADMLVMLPTREEDVTPVRSANVEQGLMDMGEGYYVGRSLWQHYRPECLPQPDDLIAAVVLSSSW